MKRGTKKTLSQLCVKLAPQEFLNPLFQTLPETNCSKGRVPKETRSDKIIASLLFISFNLVSVAADAAIDCVFEAALTANSPKGDNNF